MAISKVFSFSADMEQLALDAASKIEDEIARERIGGSVQRKAAIQLIVFESITDAIEQFEANC